MKIALFDYGAGNLHSLGKALAALDVDVRITSDWGEALGVDALVLPGVGAFGQAAAALPADPDAIRQALAGGLPCLGICLGMQLLFESSDESPGDGVGWIPGRVRRLEADVVPHMGWNDVTLADDSTGADDSILPSTGPLVAYYANSFVCEPDDPAHAIAWSEYGRGRFVAAVRKGSAWGVQFHPEKSSDAGRALLAAWVAQARGRGARVGEVALDAAREGNAGPGGTATEPDQNRPGGAA